mmetsp:Transcript_1004/g.1227  ORF Transcript_1004/g.1227 Transcript_1004/m.1227 type:complete len:96 (+) Transcript_1004:123-410(+)
MEGDSTVLGFGVLLAAGGTMGYLKKGSLPSLVAGVGSGAAFAWASQDLTTRKPQAQGLSVLLLLVMLYRLKKTGKFMPAGMISILTLGMLAKLTR